MHKKKFAVDQKNADIVSRGDYAKTLKGILAAGFCPFCEEHIFKYHTRPLLFKNRSWIVTENAWPYEGTKKHLLLITRKHVESIASLSPAAWNDLQTAYKKTIRLLNLRGATLMLRSGDTARTGASVGHLHAHIIAGYSRSKSTKPITATVAFSK